MDSQLSHIRIVVDAMGGDHAPHNVVAGAIEALKESTGGLALLLVGPENRIRDEYARLGLASDTTTVNGQSVDIVSATEVITMEDSPTAALKSKKGSSIAVGLQLQKAGNADAFVSAGNTGAVLSASTLILGRIRGVSRPTIGAMFPTAGSPCLLVDAGTNVDCRARHLFEFAIMGSIYVGSLLRKNSPRIGLLNIGEEDTKGNEVCLEAHAMLKNSKLNFAGNVEGRDILKGVVDVVVCDGFVGNILLKFGESVPSFFKAKFKQHASRSFVNTLGGLVARKGMRAVMKELDYQEHGGVPLLGVNGVTIIGHGGSTPKAIKNMIMRAKEMVAHRVNAQIEETIVNYT